MLEGDYLELVAQLKCKYDEITSKLDKVELMEIDIKKDLMTAFGVVRLLDHLISTSLVGYDNEIIVIVEVLRGLLSDCMDKHILEIPMVN